MKTLLLTLLLTLLSLSTIVMGQTKPDSIIRSYGTLMDTTKFNSLFATGSNKGMIFSDFKKRPTSVWVDNKQIMTIHPPDSMGNRKVWFDKRAVIFTSDSTFVLKVKERKEER